LPAGRLTWRTAGEEELATGKSVLVDEQGTAYALTGFNCYVLPLDGGRFLVWSAEERGPMPGMQRVISLRLIDSTTLVPLADLSAAFRAIRPAMNFYTTSEALAEATLSTALDDGVHDVGLPSALRHHGELLILAHSTAAGRRENHFDTMHLRLWQLDTGSGLLTIIPQDWFNEGAYDFGYQWVTRVARLPGSGDIVGEGIRLGLFRLDPSGRQLAEWLAEDVFYQPTADHIAEA
jgi:hypothetical protein